MQFAPTALWQDRPDTAHGPMHEQARLQRPTGFLLTMGDYLGTLAAARDLGRHGIPVVLAEPKPGTLTAHSRFVTRTVRCPCFDAPDAWLYWLLDFGRREPGHVLYATGDDLCWLLDQHRDALAQYYHLYQPRQGALYEVLNKKKLYRHCLELGIDQPRQWTAAQALSPSSDVQFPVLIKPKTQAGMPANPKAIVVQDRAELQAALRQFRLKHAYRPDMLEHDSSLGEMMVQEFHPDAAEHIYSLAGFYAPERGVYLLRGSEKVLQHPMRVGVGLCFESRPVDAGAAAQLRDLMDWVGYRGAFEVEFIRADGRFLLIDFNPRFYGQMEFEIARGIPIARLCYFAAVGDWPAVEQIAAEAWRWNHEPGRRFCNSWMLKLFVTTHWLGGNLNGPQRREWLQWAGGGECDDPLIAADDPVPARAFARQTWAGLVRHPRSTLRKFFRP